MPTYILVPSDKKYELPKEPSIVRKVTNLVKSSKEIAKDPRYVPAEVLQTRKAGCQVCPNWSPGGNFGFGKCRLCGCCKYKLNFAVMECPIGVWGKYNAGNSIPQT